MTRNIGAGLVEDGCPFLIVEAPGVEGGVIMSGPLFLPRNLTVVLLSTVIVPVRVTSPSRKMI
jgi:hypothetical protein